MDLHIKKKDLVVTADDQTLGEAIRTYSNPDPTQVNPDLKLFEEYLLVMNYDLGDSFFIPTVYIEGYEQENGRAILSITMKEIEHETLTREPQFIALGRAEKSELDE